MPVHRSSSQHDGASVALTELQYAPVAKRWRLCIELEVILTIN